MGWLSNLIGNKTNKSTKSSDNRSKEDLIAEISKLKSEKNNLQKLVNSQKDEIKGYIEKLESLQKEYKILEANLLDQVTLDDTYVNLPTVESIKINNVNQRTKSNLNTGFVQKSTGLGGTRFEKFDGKIGYIPKKKKDRD